MYKRKVEENAENQVNCILNQIKSHRAMMKQSGATVSTCPDSVIVTGDRVRLKMEAFLRRPQAVCDIHQYNKQIAEIDGGPTWTDREFAVTSHDENGDAYTLEGLYSTRKDGSDYPTLFRKIDICKFGSLKVGDIVRVSMSRIKRVRKHLTGPVIGYLNGLVVLHKFTRSLFMVTHLPGEGRTPDGHVPPGVFLDAVFSVGLELDGKPALYSRLTFETDEDVSTPWDQNPHSAAFYDYQMKDIEKVDQKDRFTGFKEYDLLHAGVETQDLFWSRERDSDPTANYLNLGTFPSVWRGPRQTTRRENGVVTT